MSTNVDMGLNYRSCDIIVFMSEIYDTDKELTHDDYIGFGLKRFAQLMNCDDIHDYYKNHVDSDNADLTYDERDSNRITLDGFDSKPDFKYEDDNRMWIGEAKANIDDVNAKNKHNDMNHLESQCRDYQIVVGMPLHSCMGLNHNLNTIDNIISNQPARLRM